MAAKILEVKRHIEDNLLGDSMTRIRALCSPEFWEALTSHESVIDAYRYYQGVNNQRDDLRKGWEYQGVIFEEYRGQAEDAEGSTQKFVPANEAIFLPRGHPKHLPHLCGARGFHRDGEHHGPAALFQAGHRQGPAAVGEDTRPVQPPAHLHAAGGAGERDQDQRLREII